MCHACSHDNATNLPWLHVQIRFVSSTSGQLRSQGAEVDEPSMWERKGSKHSIVIKGFELTRLLHITG